MRPIQSLPKDFFEPITFHPLDHRAGRFNVSTKEYYIFNHEDGYRGIKKAFDEKSEPFFLRHEEAFKGACHIFREQFGHEPDLVQWYHDENKTWNAFLVTSQTMKQKAMNKEATLFPTEARDEFRTFPLIGAFNGYSINDHPAFFLIVSTPFEEERGSFLTLDAFRFQSHDDRKLFVGQSPADRKKHLAALSKRIAGGFNLAKNHFDDLIERMRQRTIIKEFFAPVVLDLYNMNRNLESVRNDEELRGRIRKLFTQSENSLFRFRNAVPWTEFIHFIIRYNDYSIGTHSLPLSQVEELFSVKRSYQKFERLFDVFFHDDRRFVQYVDDQMGDWEKVKGLVF